MQNLFSTLTFFVCECFFLCTFFVCLFLKKMLELSVVCAFRVSCFVTLFSSLWCNCDHAFKVNHCLLAVTLSLSLLLSALLMVKCFGRIIPVVNIIAVAACCQLFFMLILSFYASKNSNDWHSPSTFSASGSIFNMLTRSPALSLPALSLDGSELVLSSVLERSADSRELFITSFFLSKTTVDPREHETDFSVKGVALHSMEQTSALIQKLAGVTYSANGARSRDVHYYCNIKLDDTSADIPLKIPAYFLPNRLTSDFHSNRKFDILRCPLETLLTHTSSAAFLHRAFVVSQKSLRVEIFREETLLSRFLVPWKTRSTGYLFSAPPSASQLQAWKGMHREQEDRGRAEKDFKPEIDTIHLCVANTQKRSLYHLIEFLEHHKQIGVQHIYFSVAFSWKSKSMQHILKSLADYISEGFLTIQSSADQQLDPNLVTSATEGIFWHPFTERVLQINSCLYLAKGNAKYIGVWDLSDFFIPSSPMTSLLEVLQARACKKDVSSGSGQNESHSSCFVAIETRSIRPNADSPGLLDDSSKLWLSSQYDKNKSLFSLSRQVVLKYIIPTGNIFQGGMKMPGGCRVSTGCGSHPAGTRPPHDYEVRNGFCYNNVSDSLYSKHQFERIKDRSSANSLALFDDVVLGTDGCLLNTRDGLLYSFQSNSEHTYTATTDEGEFEQKSHLILQTSENNYGQRFGSRVESILNAKGYSCKALLYPIFKLLPPILGTIFKGWKEFEENYLSHAIPETPTVADMSDRIPAVNSLQEKSLPSFVADRSDLCLGSLIERKHDSFQLYISTFFLQHELLYMPPEGYGVLKIRDDKATKQDWRDAILAFNDTRYSHTGQRLSPPRYYCRVSVKLDNILNVSSKTKGILLSPYSVRGNFIPNSLTVDQNANRRIDIFRCPLRHSKLLHLAEIPHSSEVLSVEIYRGKTFLKSFDIPWKTRRTGFSLSSPSQASNFDAWQNYPQSSLSQTASSIPALDAKVPGDKSNETVVHMCVPGFESPVSQRSLTVYAEFLQHHFLLGVRHMFVAGPYAWKGRNMRNFLAAFRSFIDDGLLSVASLAEGEEDEYLYSILGAVFDRDNVKVFQVSTCLYLSKGVADYVAVWDNGTYSRCHYCFYLLIHALSNILLSFYSDEFFVPSLPRHTLFDVIRAAESPHPLLQMSPAVVSAQGVQNRQSPGWADGDNHPFCFLHLSSQVIYANTPSNFDYFSPNRDVNSKGRPSSNFIGEHFNHLPETKRKGLAFQKSILPTRLIFQAGLHVGAACRLPLQWTHCNNRSEAARVKRTGEAEDEFCYSSNSLQHHGYTFENRKLTKNSPLHNFDSLVENKDARLVPKQEATLYHIQIHRYFIGASSESVGKYKINDYSKHYFPAVIKELKRRNIFDLLTTKNFQTFFESGNYWGSYLAEPDSLSSPDYIANHQLLQTLTPVQRVGAGPAGDEGRGWLDFADFYVDTLLISSEK
jgi:hypothetical protein